MRAFKAAPIFSIIFSSPVWASTQSAQQVGGAWSPYLVGVLIGGLVCLTFIFSDKAVAASSFYATVAGMIGTVIAPVHTMKLEYFKERPPKVNWQFSFIVATIFGSTIAALSGGEFAISGTPEMWINKFGAQSWLTYVAISFVGGLFIAFGARLAGGCTSGHGISGAAQLSVSSWISVICFFIGAVIAIQFIY